MNILELATELNLSYAAVYNLVMAKSNPTLDTLYKVASYFNLSIAELIGEIQLSKHGKKVFTVSVPLIEWNKIIEFTNTPESITTLPRYLISLEMEPLYNPFLTISNKNTEPFCKSGTFLLFDQSKNSEAYGYKIVLVSNLNGFLSVKRAIVEDSDIFLQNVNVEIPPKKLTSDTQIIAYLVQSSFLYV